MHSKTLCVWHHIVHTYPYLYIHTYNTYVLYCKFHKNIYYCSWFTHSLHMYHKALSSDYIKMEKSASFFFSWLFHLKKCVIIPNFINNTYYNITLQIVSTLLQNPPKCKMVICLYNVFFIIHWCTPNVIWIRY